MESKTTKEHQNASSKDITCGIITLSDSRSKKEDLSGDYLESEITERYSLKSRLVIKDERQDLLDAINKMVDENIDVILTNGTVLPLTKKLSKAVRQEFFDWMVNG